ncbi:uncharacterized protein LOC135488914 isoform X2 [Lineus longissimus]|uniref:uncharacterized protein LOC135488914 isoform X2 n=1 Tax=Lineus longissimus TaxID=88925 RepID=UPI00315D743C
MIEEFFNMSEQKSYDSKQFKMDALRRRRSEQLIKDHFRIKRGSAPATPSSLDLDSSVMCSSDCKECTVISPKYSPDGITLGGSTDRIPEMPNYFENPMESGVIVPSASKRPSFQAIARRQKRRSLEKINEASEDEVFDSPMPSPRLKERKSNKLQRRLSADDANVLSLRNLGSLARWRVRGRIKPKVPPLVRFKRIGRVVLICVAWCRYSFQKAEEVKDQLLSITQFSDEPLVASKDLLFDVSMYKATRHERVSQEAKRILQLNPEHRTEKDIKYLQIALRNINAFAEYPKKIQKAMCQVGWCESYESKRAIVRQGHPPVAFYFILSGTVVVTVYDKEAQVARTICFLHRGMEFGELALVTRSIRQATVISKSAVELLCISVEDFEDIFMDGGLKNVLDPDHLKFLKNISFMKNWPLERLSDEPRKCLFHYFNRGQVLVRDSNYSDWIYIVKSGSLSVMKKLKQVRPNLHERVEVNTDDDDSPRDTEKKKQLPKKSPDRLPRTLYELERQMEKSLPGIHDRRERLGTIDYDTIIEQRVQQFRELRHQRHAVLPSIEKVAQEPEPDPDKSPDVVLDELSEEDEILFEENPLITKTTKGAFLSTGKRKKPVSKWKKERKKMSKNLQALEAKVKKGDDTLGRKTLADDLDNKPTILPFGREKATEADLHPTFIVVQVLERGQYFGVGQMVFREQTSLSIVSNGAECIMISKKFFKEHSNDMIMRDLRRGEIPYPMEEEMQANLQNSVNWESHRAKTYNTIAEIVEARKLRKRQLLPLSIESIHKFGNT